MSCRELEKLAFRAHIYRDMPERLKEEITVAPTEQKKVTAMQVSTSWLEDQVSEKVSEFQQQRADAAKAADDEQKKRVKSANDTLRLQLGLTFIDRAGVKIGNGAATLNYKGEIFTITVADSDLWMQRDGDEKQVISRDLPGNAPDRIIAMLAKREDSAQ